VCVFFRLRLPHFSIGCFEGLIPYDIDGIVRSRSFIQHGSVLDHSNENFIPASSLWILPLRAS